MKHEVAAIVEGHGEVKAVGVLIRRIAAEVRPEMLVDVLPPLRVPRAKLVKPDELERTVELAARKTSGRGAVLVAPADPEGIRGAKEWLTSHMVAGAKYREVLDQPALTARLDLAAARRSDSFDKCFREIAR